MKYAGQAVACKGISQTDRRARPVEWMNPAASPLRVWPALGMSPTCPWIHSPVVMGGHSTDYITLGKSCQYYGISRLVSSFLQQALLSLFISCE